MQFGLDARDKENSATGLLSTPVSNSRKRIEARAYRTRDRCDNGWFRHEDAPSPATSTTPVKVLDPGCCCHCGSHISLCGSEVRLASAMTPSSVSRAEGRQNRDRALGHSHPDEWCSQGKLTPKKEEKKDALDGRQDVEVLRKREFYPNSKDWYRHEHTMVCVDEDKIPRNLDRTPEKVLQLASPLWWPLSVGSAEGAVKQSPRPRVMGPDAESYWQRAHDGSAKEWYTHEHEMSNPPTPSSTAHNGAKDGNETAAVTERDSNEMCCRCHAKLNMCDYRRHQPRQALAEKFLLAK